MSNIDYMHKNKKVTPFQVMLSLPPSSIHVMDQDIWVEIFKEFPIESLCRLRSVCKWWNCIISSASFINLHHSLTRSTTPCNLRCYLHVANRTLVYSANPNYTRLNHRCYTLCRPLDVVEHSRQPLYFPFQPDRDHGHYTITFVGVIHGVVCYSYSWSPHFIFSFPSYNSTFLWNPTIHKYVALPRLRLPGEHTVGFGYDTSRKDFKVVLICMNSGTYRVYSARQGWWSTATAHTGVTNRRHSWRFTAMNRPCFINGTIHWTLSKTDTVSTACYALNKHSVLMFDCEREEFRRMEVPEKLFWSSGQSPLTVELFEYAGMLAALADMGLCGGERLELWVMEEHGACTSWKKLYMIPTDGHITIYDPSFEKLAPYGPNNLWNMYNGNTFFSHRLARFGEILSVHVYDQTMLLMDHPKVQSYTKQEIVTIVTEGP